MNTTNLTLLLSILLICSIYVFSTESGAQTEESDALVETWLLKSCEAGEEQKVQNEIVEQGSVLEPVFLEAYNSGPDQELITEVEASAASNFDKRTVMLEQGETFGLNEKDLDALKSVSREDFITAEKNAFVMRYKSQALSGLGLVGDQQSYELLKGISEDPDSPMQITAQEALKNIRYEEPDTPEQEGNGEPAE